MKIRSDFKVNYLSEMTPEILNDMISYNAALDDYITYLKRIERNGATKLNINKCEYEHHQVSAFIKEQQLILILNKYNT